jgi:mono/diheme cytochrome c family protein
MLATAAFLAFWIVLGLALFFVAARGGPRGARATLQSQSRGGRRTAMLLFTVFYVGVGVAVPVAILIGNHDDASARVGGASIALDAEQREGQEIFGERCASCHTLAGAHADGKVGPNLDMLRPPEELVLDAVEKGRLRGSGTMPAQLVQGTEAEAVAAFVAAVAGKQ